MYTTYKTNRIARSKSTKPVRRLSEEARKIIRAKYES